MLKKISSYCFSWELKDHHSWFLKYHATYLNTKERSSFYHLPALKKISFLIWTPFERSPFSKLIIWLFLFFLLWTILSCKVHVFVIISLFLLNILKDFLNIHYKGKSETELRNFFFSDFSIATAWYTTKF